MDATTICHSLLKTDLFLIVGIHIDEGQIQLKLESLSDQANCPICKMESARIHSTYTRHPSDLAWAEYPVHLEIITKRYFCQNTDCPKRTFAERFPDYLAWYARRTDRVIQKQQRIGVNVCAIIAEKLLRMEQIRISDTSINRLIRNLPEPDAYPIRVLGVDDWAKRKRLRYGTILVDLERGQVVDLLQERTAEPLVKWLENHPGIEIITRDRSQTYAGAISRGAPNASQVADRWHLIKNASDALVKILQQEHSLIKKQFDSEPKPAQRDDIQVSNERLESELTKAEQKRKQRMKMVGDLYLLGWSRKKIANKINIHPRTVRRYLRSPIPKRNRRQRSRTVDPYIPYLLRRWNEGCHNGSTLFIEIQKQGFRGQATMVRKFLQPFRKNLFNLEKDGNPSVSTVFETPSSQTIAYWILKKPEDRKEEHEKIIEQIKSVLPKLALTITQARAFASMIRKQHTDELDTWIKVVEQSSYRIWKNFATGIQKDKAAVQMSIISAWSNGPTEGHVNRLKCIKRQMYGRANDDLLRMRVLWHGRWGFT